MAVFDGEEIGSGGTSGAASDLLSNTLERISFALGKNGEEHFSSLAQSFFVSSDSAHSLHPNHPELFDKNTAPLLNEGIAIKYNSQKRYTTTALSAAIFSEIAKTAQVPCQIYANRSDIPGGTTLGHIVQGNVSVMCVDVGASVLSMHSSSETAGAIDTEYLSRAFEMFYSVSIEKNKNGYSIN